MRFARLPVLLFVVAGLLVGGCSKQEPTISGTPPPLTGEIQIAGIGKAVHPFWDQVEMGMKDAVKTTGGSIEFFVPSKEDAQKQAEKIKSWVAVGKKGILFAASDPETVGPAIKDAIGKGITCVAMDTDAPQSGRAAYVGTDNYAAGKIAGETLGELLGGKGKVCVATGSVTASNSLERIKGFKEALQKKFPGVTVLPEILVDNEDRAVAEQKAKAKIAATPDLAAFFGVYAINGPACANAVKSAGKTGKIKVVCFDNMAEHMNMLKSGMIDAVVGQRPYLMGKKGVELITAIIKDGKDKAMRDMGVSNGVIDTGVDVVQKTGVEKYRKDLQKLGIPTKGW